tara:strand:- start:1727 stop:2218 length:492 start_codon:yes stop_codon:yes gene_type:complete
MEIELPDLPDSSDLNLTIPNTEFVFPIAEVPYLDPSLLPSLEQVQGGLQNQESLSSEGDKEKSTEEVQPITPPQGLNNLPTTKETLSTEEPVATFNIPFFGEMPIPAPEVVASSVISAGAASIVTVTGSIAMQAVVAQIKKIFKKIFTKVLKKEIANRQKDQS